MYARVLMPAHVLVLRPRMCVSTPAHATYNNVIQTLPHGSRYRLSVARSVERMTHQKSEYSIDTDVDTENTDARASARLSVQGEYFVGSPGGTLEAP